MNLINSKKEAFYSSPDYLKLLDLERGTDRLKKAFRILSEYKNKRFLDIGCGKGDFTEELKKISPDVFAVEISHEGVAAAKKKGINAEQLDIDEQDLPFQEDYFDAVFCGEFIEHVVYPDHLLEEIHRVLKKGGVAVITTPNLANYFNRLTFLFGFQPYFSGTGMKYNTGKFFGKDYPCPHLIMFTLKALKELLQLHGFKIRKIMGANSTQIFPLFFRPIDAVLTVFPSLATHLIFVAER